MTKIILLTGATDGIGFETTKSLASEGHTLLIHGRSEAKLENTKAELEKIEDAGVIETFRADLSNIDDVIRLANSVTEKHSTLDVLINNAGVFKMPNAVTDTGHDLRFIVNTVAPYLLTQKLLPIMPADGRVVNLSSAAQASVDLRALKGGIPLTDNQAYGQSKLAITMWSFNMAQQLGADGPAIIAVNPASFLASKMVKDAYGVDGHDLSVGADILVRTALSDEFEGASGRYFDNDQKRFSDPHADALNTCKNAALVAAIEDVIADLTN
jgi:NAD(P)-dependent dehydrogenase (short-subunit alcohol dehydrogenase family)